MSCLYLDLFELTIIFALFSFFIYRFEICKKYEKDSVDDVVRFICEKKCYYVKACKIIDSFNDKICSDSLSASDDVVVASIHKDEEFTASFTEAVFYISTLLHEKEEIEKKFKFLLKGIIVNNNYNKIKELIDAYKF